MGSDRQEGFCVWFTGLSASGKTTTAEMLVANLTAHGLQVTLLDGDVVRAHVSKELGFSHDDRVTNIRRVGIISSEIVGQGGAVVCALISPYRAAREECRNLIGRDRFVEVFVDTPLEICITRDPKGLYAKAKRGEIGNMTGIDDPYEPPAAPEMTLDTVRHTAIENVDRIMRYLADREFYKRKIDG